MTDGVFCLFCLQARAVDRCVKALTSAHKKTDGGGARGRVVRGYLLLTAVAVMWMLSVGAHVAFAVAAKANYPGGVAFGRLHAGEPSGRRFEPGRVHIDAAAAMTGVSRFGESSGGLSGNGGSKWVYSKEEGLSPRELATKRRFDYFVSGEAEVPGYEVVDAIEGYVGLAVVPMWWPPIRARTEPKIWLHKRRP